MTTKEKILNEALKLFSKRGYSDVSVNDIATAVGIKAPSLYKHYNSKQSILDSCVEMFSERMKDVRNSLMVPGSDNSTTDYKNASLNMITSFAMGLFIFYLRDDIASKFRKMLMIERYRNADINKVYEDIFVNGAIDYEEKIFAELIETGVLKNEDPHILALRFYTPIYFLIQKYDMLPDHDEDAKLELKAIIEEFCSTYKGN